MKTRGPIASNSVTALALALSVFISGNSSSAQPPKSAAPAKTNAATTATNIKPSVAEIRAAALKAREERITRIRQLRMDMAAATKRQDMKAVIRISTELLEFPMATTDYLETRAGAYSMLKDREEAIKDLTACIRIKPTALLYRRRSVEYHRMGDDAKARADTAEAIKLEPKASSMLEQARLQMNHEDYNTAIATARKALTMLDTEPAEKRLLYEIAAHDQIGLGYMQLKEYTKAKDEIDKALSLTPEWVQATKKNDRAHIRSVAKWNSVKLLRRGECFEKLGKLKEAQADYELVVEVNPKNFDYRRSLLRLYRKGEQNDKALALVNQMLQEDDSPDLYYKRAEIYKKLGKEALAKTDLTRARKIEYDLMGSINKPKD